MPESKFYCFGGIETLPLIITIVSHHESKFYCFGGIETDLAFSGIALFENLNSTASAVLRLS